MDTCSPMHIYKQRPTCTFMAYGYTTKKNKRRNVRLFLQVFFFLSLLLKSKKQKCQISHSPCQFSVTLTNIDTLFSLFFNNLETALVRILVLREGSDNEGLDLAWLGRSSSEAKLLLYLI